MHSGTFVQYSLLIAALSINTRMNIKVYYKSKRGELWVEKLEPVLHKN